MKVYNLTEDQLEELFKEQREFVLNGLAKEAGYDVAEYWKRTIRNAPSPDITSLSPVSIQVGKDDVGNNPHFKEAIEKLDDLRIAYNGSEILEKKLYDIQMLIFKGMDLVASDINTDDKFTTPDSQQISSDTKK